MEINYKICPIIIQTNTILFLFLRADISLLRVFSVLRLQWLKALSAPLTNMNERYLEDTIQNTASSFC